MDIYFMGRLYIMNHKLTPILRRWRTLSLICFLSYLLISWILIPSLRTDAPGSYVKRDHRFSRPGYSNIMQLQYRGGFRNKPTKNQVSKSHWWSGIMKNNVLSYFSQRNSGGPFLKLQLSGGRLGNVMFAYGSLLGIARQNGMIPCISAHHYLRSAFAITAQVCPEHEDSDWEHFVETRPGAYDSRTLQLHRESDMELHGYFQSWKYFVSVSDEIHQEFTFTNFFTRVSKVFLRNAARRTLPDVTNASDVVYIGLHVRRGDMLDDINVSRGYVVADVEYLEKAMAFYLEKYNERNTLFVVISDDMRWAKLSLNKFQVNLVFSFFGDEIQDLSILSQCNHTVMTVGTYGWWGAWLAGGNTVFYSRFAIPGSALEAEYEPDDYFCPNWVGMPRH